MITINKQAKECPECQNCGIFHDKNISCAIARKEWREHLKLQEANSKWAIDAKNFDIKLKYVNEPI